jgi:NAD(P)-dependent dehydrogenase (short-subunit alcohol dehydrogenase family)
MALDDKVALITGGGRGIGRAVALAMARAGAKTVLAARTREQLEKTAREINEQGRQALAIPVDLAREKQVADMVRRVIDRFEKIDILVNNSGVEGPVADVASMETEGWSHTLRINLTGAMLTAKHILQDSMLPRQSGSIINIASIAGRRGVAYRSSYIASKFGLIGFTQSLASEVGRRGIRVNCIAPGLVKGERVERIMRDMAEKLRISVSQAIANFTSRTALGRMVDPEEVAHLAVFLASDLSSGITGQTINVCAGLEMN